jgi:hypothetical protein
MKNGGPVESLQEMVSVGEQGTEFIIPRSWVDYIGFVASLLCAVHCILTPLFLMAIPIVGSYFVYSYQVEIIFVLCSVFLAFFSVCWGYRLHTKNYLFMLFSVASFFLISGIFVFHKTMTGFLLLGIGGVLLAITHFINYKLCARCNHC